MSKESVNKRLRMIDDLQADLNKVKALLDESLGDNNDYQEIEEEAAKIRNAVKEKKMKILAEPAYKKYEEQMKEMRDEIKEIKEVLAQDLADYYKEFGTLEIVDDEGNKKRIKFSVKLISS